MAVSTIENPNRAIDFVKTKIDGAVKIYGFTNKLAISIGGLNSTNYYGTATVITSAGTMTVELVGYTNTTTTTTGNIKTYKHNVNDVLDYQFVFPSSYIHGVLIVSGSATQGFIVTQTA